MEKLDKAEKKNTQIVEAEKEYPPRIPEGEYDATCYAVETGRSWGGRMDIYIKFRLIDLSYNGFEVFMACTYNKRKLSPRTKYYEQWVTVTRRLPGRHERMNPEVFLDKMYVVKVRDAIPKYNDKSPKPDIFRYSVVERIVRVQTGK